MKLKNTTNLRQCFSGMKCFEPGEIREVDEVSAELLLKSPFIAEAAEKKQKKDKKTDSKSAE